MVKKIINILGQGISKEIKGLHEAAYLLALFSFFSQILALLRDRLLAGNFGASLSLDIYYASFRIPDFIFVIVTSLVSASVLIPIFAKNLDDKKEIKKTIDSIFTVFLLGTLIICIIVFIYTPNLLKIFMPGFVNEDNFYQLVLFTRILLLSPFLLGLSQLLGGVVQAYRRFFIYAISPILYNIGIVVGILYFLPVWGLVGLVWGVILGAFLHFIFQIPFICKNKTFPKITLRVDLGILKKILSLSLPRSLALLSSQITFLLLISLASTFVVGSISVFTLAYNLQSVPLSIIGVSYSLAAFPTLAKLFSNGEKKVFFESVVSATKHIIFWSIPVIALFIVLRAQIVRTILGTGEFSWADTRLTAAALAIFAISVLSQSLILLFVRAYYSAGKTIKPVVISFISSAIIVFLAFYLSDYYEKNSTFSYFFENILRVQNIEGVKILTLSLAFSFGTIFQSILLWFFFVKDFGVNLSKKTTNFFKSISDSLIVSILVGYVAYVFLQVFDNLFDLNTLFGIFMQGFLSGLMGIIFGIIALLALQNLEIKEVIKTLNHKFWKVRPENVASQNEI